MPFQHALVLVLSLLMLTLPVGAPFAAEQVRILADCEKSPYGGAWVSSDPDNPFLSRLEVVEVCKQIVTKPVAMDNPWAGSLGRDKKYIYREFTLRPSSTCSPSDCVWGRVKAELGPDGQLTARFRMFWSLRHLKLKRENDRLHVSWRIEYLGRRKPDQLGETILVSAK